MLHNEQMRIQQRLYESLLSDHLATHRQMAFVSGPRQVGKTTTCRDLSTVYLDWDNEDHREIILRGPASVAAHAGLHLASDSQVILTLDELHKYHRWKSFLKGFFDTYEGRVRIMVTGSSRLEVYRRGGDSLMGRYFSFRMHPLSLAELIRTEPREDLIGPPAPVPSEEWDALLEHGGYPEPFLARSQRFSRRWRRTRAAQLFKEDVRDLTRIQQLDLISTLGRLLAERSGEQLVYSSLARSIRVSENTVRSWIATLVSLHYGFLVRPWYKNVTRSLRKEPKWFLRDWSGISDAGQRTETLVACHLLKAVDNWTDQGHGEFELRYVRDKQKREVDFLVVRDGRPWFLIEAKSSDPVLSRSLVYFHQQLKCDHAFQVVVDAEFLDTNAFAYHDPVVVPFRTLFSQLV
jgi:predicted AAA+ superfamily ATPase